MRRRHFLISSTALGASILFAENGNAQRAYTCNYVQTSSNGFSLTDSWLRPGSFRTQRVMDFGIDRQSFLDRGWTNSQIGNWNPSNKRKSLFLSAFYALQMNNANDLKHPWNEPSHDWDRGMGAHMIFGQNTSLGNLSIFMFMTLYKRPIFLAV